MKYYRILFLAAAATALASCAMDELKDYEVEKPQSIAQYEYLNDYDVLKNYVDRTASPTSSWELPSRPAISWPVVRYMPSQFPTSMR